MLEETARARALLAVARTRAVGLHFYGHFLGLSAPSGSTDGTRLLLDREPFAGREFTSPMAVASLAALTLSSAVRAHLESGSVLNGVTLGMQHVGRARGPIAAEASAVAVDPAVREGFARCDLRDADHDVVATAQGWFAASPASARQIPPMPWEVPGRRDVAALTEDDLDYDERAAVEAATKAGARAAARGTSLVEELLNFSWRAGVTDEAAGTVAIGPELTNRVGHVQGGAVYGAALRAASRAAGPDAHLVDGHLQFLRPMKGPDILAEARVIRRGRRVVFTEARLTSAGVCVAQSRFSFRRSTN